MLKLYYEFFKQNFNVILCSIMQGSLMVVNILINVSVWGYPVWRTMYWVLGNISNFVLRLTRNLNEESEADIAIDELEVTDPTPLYTSLSPIIPYLFIAFS